MNQFGGQISGFPLLLRAFGAGSLHDRWPDPRRRAAPFRPRPAYSAPRRPQLVAAGSVWKYLDNGSNQGTS